MKRRIFLAAWMVSGLLILAVSVTACQTAESRKAAQEAGSYYSEAMQHVVDPCIKVVAQNSEYADIIGPEKAYARVYERNLRRLTLLPMEVARMANGLPPSDRIALYDKALSNCIDRMW